MSIHCDDIFNVSNRLHILELKVDNLQQAFLKNDVGGMDFDGHRRYHEERIAQAGKLDEYKHEATKKIIGVVLGLAITAAGGAVIKLISGV